MIMPMSRPRKTGNKDLRPGLYRRENGVYRMKHPVNGKFFSLDTKDRQEAETLYDELMRHLMDEVSQAKADKLVKKIKGDELTLAEFAKVFREDHLPTLLGRKRKPINDESKKAYNNFLKNSIELFEGFDRPISYFSHPDNGPQVVRQYLSQWLNMPSPYNYRKACLSRVFQTAIDLGLLQRNPCTAIKNRESVSCDVIIPKDHAKPILGRLAADYGDYVAMAVNWLYVVSGRPSDMLDVREQDISDTHLHYTANKNSQPVIMPLDDELIYLSEWFRNFKKKQGIVSQHLIVHPGNVDKKIRYKAISREWLYRRFKAACVAVGYPDYTLRHLRPSALTEEARQAGESTNKGAHKTKAMQDHYVKEVQPMAVTNNLKCLWRPE